MMNVLRSRRRLLAAFMAGMLLLGGGVAYEAWQRAPAVMHDYPPMELAFPAAAPGAEFVMTNINFAGNVDLWLNPGPLPYDGHPTYADLMFKSQIRPADFNQLATRLPDGKSYASLLTMADKDITYALFSIGSFKATFNMTPVKAKPEDLFPTQLKPGLGGGFDF